MPSFFPILVSPLPSAPWHLAHLSAHVVFASAAWAARAGPQTRMTANARFFISLGVVGLGLACGVRSHRSRHWGASIGHTAEMNYASIGQDSAYFAGAQVAAAGVRPVCAGSPADGGRLHSRAPRDATKARYPQPFP